MKILYTLALLATFLAAAEPEAALKVECQSVGSETDTMWYHQTVTYSLEGYTPLTIKADVERGIYPSGAREIHKLSKSRFLTLGGYSSGGGMFTTVMTIIEGRDGRLFIQDTLEFTRARGDYADQVSLTKGAFLVSFPPLPAPEAEVHALYSWQIDLHGTRYEAETIRSFELRKLPEQQTPMIVFQIDAKGFVLPKLNSEKPTTKKSQSKATDSK